MMHSHETQRDVSPCVTHMNTVVDNLSSPQQPTGQGGVQAKGGF